MAKKAKASETKTEAAKPSEVRKAISQGKLRTLLKAKRSAKKDIAEISGTLGNAIGKAVENDYLDRKVFGWVSQLDMMEPEKLAYHLDNLDHYLDISGLRDRAADAPRLPIPDDTDEGDDNVRPFPAPSGVAAE